jgi:hypothetical protein
VFLWAFLICVCNEAGKPSKRKESSQTDKKVGWPLGLIVFAEFPIKNIYEDHDPVSWSHIISLEEWR